MNTKCGKLTGCDYLHQANVPHTIWSCIVMGRSRLIGYDNDLSSVRERKAKI
jgi:hypothetical protein